MKYFTFPCTNIMSIGIAVMSEEDPQVINEEALTDGVGGSWRGEASVNGMKDPRLGNKQELGIRCNCCKMANIRKWRVM